jgi:hypothetical protein
MKTAESRTLPREWYDPKGRRRCPTCDSPRPGLHPAVQEGGEVQPCPDDFHGCAHVLKGPVEAFDVTDTVDSYRRTRYAQQCGLCLAYVPVENPPEPEHG